MVTEAQAAGSSSAPRSMSSESEGEQQPHNTSRRTTRARILEDDNFVDFDVTDDHDEFPSGDEGTKDIDDCDGSRDSGSEDDPSTSSKYSIYQQ